MTVPFRISIKAARINVNLSLDEAAKKIGVNKRTLINYEKGTTIPNWETADKMSDVYGIPTDYLRFEKAPS